MIDPILTNSVVPFSGSALCGFAMGFALKKILKWILIGLGVLAGIIFLVIQWMSQNGYVKGPVEWDKLGTDITSYGQHTATQLDFNGIIHSLGIPVTSGMGIGLAAGLIKG